MKSNPPTLVSHLDKPRVGHIVAMTALALAVGVVWATPPAYAEDGELALDLGMTSGRPTALNTGQVLGVATAFTHGFAAGLLALAAPRDVARGRLSCLLALVAAAPDLDVVGFWLGIPYAHPLGHRGLSHSIAFALLVGALPRTGCTRSCARESATAGM